MNRLRRHNEQSASAVKRALAEQTYKPPQTTVGYADLLAKATLSGRVVDTNQFAGIVQLGLRDTIHPMHDLCGAEPE
jgi:hypothetical protein